MNTLKKLLNILSVMSVFRMYTLKKTTEFTEITEIIYKKESVSKHENTIKMSCHPERSEGSVYCFQILRDAQNDILTGDFYFDSPPKNTHYTQ